MWACLLYIQSDSFSNVFSVNAFEIVLVFTPRKSALKAVKSSVWMPLKYYKNYKI